MLKMEVAEQILLIKEEDALSGGGGNVLVREVQIRSIFNLTALADNSVI